MEAGTEYPPGQGNGSYNRGDVQHRYQEYAYER